MAEKKKSGCLGAALAVFFIGAILVVGILAALWTSKARSSDLAEEEAQARAAAVTTLVFQEDDLPRFPFPKAGETITREQFVAHMIDDNATDLAKESFRKIASQASVSWKLRTNEIEEDNGKIIGSFDLPWEINRDRSSRGSSVRVRCYFTEESRLGLLDLRRNDWATVHGSLSFDGNTATIKNARLQGDPLPAEKP